MAFEVVLVHYWDTTTGDVSICIKLFADMKMLAVPIFMLLSFILVGNDIILTEKVSMRFKRLCVPHIGWALLYYTIFQITNCLAVTDWPVGPRDLFLQLITGSSPNLCPPLWYQEVIIILTAIFYLVFKLIPKKAGLLFSILLMLGALYLQYTGITYNLFKDLPYELTYILGRIPEMIPYAVVGIFLADRNIIEYLRKDRMYKLVILVLLLYLVWHIDLFAVLTYGFGYQGLRYVATSVVLVLMFITIPFYRMADCVRSIIDWFSKYTLGIYCIHWLVGKYMNLFLEKQCIRVNSFRECVVIYVTSLVISVLIGNLSGNIWKQLVK